MDYDDVIERAKAALCAKAIEVANEDKSEDWFADQYIRAAAPILMEYGARLMREAAANGLEAYAKAYTEQKARAKAEKDPKVARDFESMAMACAFRSTEIRAIDPAAIVKEAVK